ncbi:MAG: hydantoinase/oxoprolinase family protein [Acidobacteriota bacterium]
MLRIGIDTGGTFTDFVIVHDAHGITWKEPSTPSDPARAILAGLRRLIRKPAGRGEIVHGSTVATNALLENKIARVAFVTNRGFEDLLEIGRQARPELYNLSVRRVAPPVPRGRRFGLSGRLDHAGTTLEEIVEEELACLSRRFEQDAVEAVAICLLHSYANAAQEERVARYLQRPGLVVCVSSRIVPEYREYERASTVAVNAAVAPVVSSYLSVLGEGLKSAGLAAGSRLRIMGSNGGALSPTAAREQAVRTVLSGPAAGVRAAEFVGRAIGCERIISLDMGGTSTDVSLIEGRARMTPEVVVAGHPVRIPAIDIHTVGAGGGSIGWCDAGGALRVGPASAGADPGPACDGRGGPPTVTDANLMLGRMVPERFLDGRMALDLGASARALEALGRPLQLDPTQVAEGMLEVAEATMTRAIRVISLYRGYEPGDFTLLAFGGAGGLHAAALAGALEMRHAVVPHGPGVFSAFGMTVSDVMRDRSRSLLAVAAAVSPTRLEEEFARLEESCRRDLEADGVTRSRMVCERTLDLRYAGQSHELNLPFERQGRGWQELFHDEHRRRFGYDRPDQPIEIVTLRVRGIGRIEAPPERKIDSRGRSLRGARLGSRPVTWRGKPADTAVYLRDKIPPSGGAGGEEALDGPALILDSGATTFVPPSWRAHLDHGGHLHLERSG